MPGHPLLLNERSLVYPETYLFPKCKPGLLSIPFFHFVLHGHAQAATRTSRTLIHAVSAGTASASLSRSFSPLSHGETRAAAPRAREHGLTFQWPLPANRPSQASTALVHSAPLPPPPPSPPPGRFVQVRIPAPPPGMFGSPRIQPPLRTDSVMSPYGAAPLPGAVVVLLGEARMGGMLCWWCSGRGTTP